jgi:outer membrane protein, multidrug efflux system
MKPIKLLFSTALCTLASFLAGCSMAPSYERPASPVSESWPEYGDDEQVSSDSAGLEWRDFFTDNQLQRLISLALENNRDLEIAGLNVERIQALYRIQRSNLVPSLEMAGSGTRQRIPADLSSTGEAMTTSTYNVGGLMSSYELDFFGRVTSLKDEALENYLASKEARLSYETSLVSSVARQYFSYLAAQEQLKLVCTALEAAEQVHALNRQIYENGVGSELMLRSSETQLFALRANVSAVREQVAQSRNALVFLVGTSIPEDLLLPESLDSRILVEDLPIGLPSDLLIRRADIRSAEHNLMAINAHIGAARAAFFPSVRLTAFGGTASSELSGLFESNSGSWSFSPSISLPIFSGGRNKANLDVAWVMKNIEVANYEKAIQKAFREVSDALAARVFIDEQLNAQEARVTAADRRYELSSQLFKAGHESLMTVLLAQQELVGAEQSLVQIRLSRLNNLTSLFTALGGGWDETNNSPDTRG